MFLFKLSTDGVDVTGATPIAGTIVRTGEVALLMEDTWRRECAMNVATGDVIEIDVDGEAISAMVLLATPEAVILDACDGSTPFVIRPELLVNVRIFDPLAA
jgi:hypothetical protein